ncbi:SLC13 family permease [Catalinimonas niigatensis]|uniref:SLC13 family permease n=1 Tax=Catalinimonas niigatensis TaxID=1397264 RepID=UPI002665859E|nr:SLC13 family permease [Catalinimonas niigatensis]WPP53196.1 SLC13 family permease [Catalinimonas niigatensis]
MLSIIWQQIIVLGSICVLFVCIYKEWVRPSLGFLLTVLSFVALDILTPEEMISGFSNQSIGSVVLLILISAALRKNFQIEAVIESIYKLGRKNLVLSYRSFLLRMMIQVAIFSSFINNTPIVAIMTPYVFNWGKRHNVSPSKLLIPLSYATIMGGMLTVIGTSTTLVLTGFMMDYEIGFLNTVDLLCIGGAVCLTGILMISTVGYRLLPDHKNILESFSKNKREYLVETVLDNNSPMRGKTIVEAGLRSLKGVYLVEIIRANDTLSPVEPTEKIEQADVLIFAGDTENIVELLSNGRGLILPKPADTRNEDKVNVIEAVVGTNSSLVGRTPKEMEFRKRYDAAIVAIHRNGERLSGKIGNIQLSQGDLLLLYAGKHFKDRVDLYRDIFIVSQVKEFLRPNRKKVTSFLIVALSAIAMVVFGYFTLFVSLLIIFTIMIALKMISIQDIKNEIDLNMVSILVFSLALGQAMVKTGSGDLLADGILDLTQDSGPLVILASLLVITTLLTSFITNVGAISITFPLAYAISNSLGVDGMPFYLGIAYAASAAFLTPIGYQTNLIVYGPGGYTFRDFLKIGLPVSIVYLLTVLFMIRWLYADMF